LHACTQPPFGATDAVHDAEVAASDGGCSSARQWRGGENESGLRLDRLSARAKQAGLTTKGA
jgi:hypothetical protein